MAKIIENAQGRRLVRLSVEDVLTVVTLYKQQMNNTAEPPQNHRELVSCLSQRDFYLPEEV